MTRWLLLLPLAITACSERPTSAVPEDVPINAPPEQAGTTTGSNARPVVTLAGEWRVAGIDRESFDEPYGLALSADNSQIWWSPRCAGFVRSYRIDGTSVRFERDTSARPDSSGNPPPVCTIAPPARINAVFTALDAADRVIRTPANAIEISGGGHSLTLFSQ